MGHETSNPGDARSLRMERKSIIDAWREEVALAGGGIATGEPYRTAIAKVAQRLAIGQREVEATIWGEWPQEDELPGGAVEDSGVPPEPLRGPRWWLDTHPSRLPATEGTDA